MLLSFATSLYALAEDGAEHGAALMDGGLLAEWAWLIPVVPMVVAFAIVFFGKRLPLKGWELAEGAMAFVAVYGTALLVRNWIDPIHFEDHVNVADIGPLAIEWGWVVDGLSIMMFFVVGVVGLAVFTYAKGYMKGDVRYTWFFSAFTLFAGGMLVLVSSANMVQLIVGWELVGVASYLLIGHYWEDDANNAAAIKAFLVNKVADVGLFIGVIIAAVTVGSFRFTDVLDAVEAHDGALADVAFWVGLALFIGAMGKSAQFPFHVWLPDAMAGPTPVSALMHAATMVTAGVYLIARVMPIYTTDGFAGDVQTLIIIVGAVTLLVTGLMALVQDDIKKVLAYSTLSQLGYMTAAMGAGAYTAGLFHLFTHAFFKALLFLGAGSVIHAVHSNNMSDMGGLRKKMPYTFWTFLIGSLALAGIFPLAGFWSKDEILASLDADAFGLGSAADFALYIAIAGAFVTAFYMARVVWLTFFGTYKGAAKPHESPKVMTLPLVGLAVGAVAFGWAGISGVTDTFTDWVGARLHSPLDGALHFDGIDVRLAIIGTVVALAGIAAASALFRKDAPSQAARDRFRIPGLYPLLERRYYIDDFYVKGVVGATTGPIARAVDWSNTYIIDSVVNGAATVARWGARIVYDGIDQRGIDLGINALSAGTGEAGEALRHSQTGKVQQYAGVLFSGAVLLVIGFLIFG